MATKLEFTLSPVSGTLKKQGGYRAKLSGDRRDRIVNLDGIIEEARLAGAFQGITNDLMKMYLRGILQTMIENTCKDGRTRKIDEFLSVGVNVHGRFDAADEDFDPEKHELALVIRPLGAFWTRKIDVVPVNKNRRRQFRIYSVVDAENADKGANNVYLGHEFIINGADLSHEGDVYVACTMWLPNGHNMTVNPRIISRSDTEIRCAWPDTFGADVKGDAMDVTLIQDGEAAGESEDSRLRTKRVTVWMARG